MESQITINDITPLVIYDPANIGGDLSAVMVVERQTVTQYELFDNPVTYPRFMVYYTADLKNQDYHVQIDNLDGIIRKVKSVYRRDPDVLVDVTGNEGLSDMIRALIPSAYLMKFSGGMVRPRAHSGRYHVIDKPYWVRKVALLLEKDQIQIDTAIPDYREIKKQLESFAGTVRKSGTVSYEADGDAKDDFVSCLLMAVSHPDHGGIYSLNMPHSMTGSYYAGKQSGAGMRD
jgi:hypothetical protein